MSRCVCGLGESIEHMCGVLEGGDIASAVRREGGGFRAPLRFRPHQPKDSDMSDNRTNLARLAIKLEANLGGIAVIIDGTPTRDDPMGQRGSHQQYANLDDALSDLRDLVTRHLAGPTDFADMLRERAERDDGHA
jgi:hypothetical protein